VDPIALHEKEARKVCLKCGGDGLRLVPVRILGTATLQAAAGIKVLSGSGSKPDYLTRFEPCECAKEARDV